jgi:hypothetical protein
LGSAADRTKRPGIFHRPFFNKGVDHRNAETSIDVATPEVTPFMRTPI